MLKGLNFVAIVSLMGWAWVTRPAAHSVRFMAADSHHTIVHARRISMMWMILAWRARARLASSALRTLATTRRRRRGEPERRARVHRTGADSV
ncbi:hypothetical protein ACVXG7_02000 [Enterobacter hormaechei]